MDYTKDAVLIEELIKVHEAKLNTSQITLPNTTVEFDEYDDYNDTLGYVPYSMRPETYIVPILFAIIFIIGVLGNGTLILIFLKHRTMRNVPNMYIVSLAVGDLFVILFCVPFTSTVYTVESWPYGVFVCKFSEFIKDLSVGVSVFTLTALSADRYFAIADPMRKLHGRRATRITCITIAGIWLLSVLMALPSAVFSYVRAIDQDPSRIFYVCYPFPPEFGDKYPQVMVLLRFLIYYAIPLGFIGTFYIIMARHLVLSTRNMPGEAQGQAKQIQARKKVAKMILSFVMIFALCFFPSHLFLLWFYYYPDSENNFNEFWNACRIIGFCFSFINSCVNPITLYCVSGTFRKQFNEHLFCCFCDAEGHSRGTRRRAGFVCGCVSLSGAGPGGHIGGNDFRYRNGYSHSQGRGLYRGSTLTNSGQGILKRKSTFDTQTTMSHNHLYNLQVNVNPSHPLNLGGATDPTATATAPTALTELQKHSNISNSTRNNVNNPTSTNTNLNSSFPLTHHPYQKDYQEYMNRINALEKGDPPSQPKPNSSPIKPGSTKLPQSPGGGGIAQEEYTVTSFINLPPVNVKVAPGINRDNEDGDSGNGGEGEGEVEGDVHLSKCDGDPTAGDKKIRNNNYD